MAPSLSLRALLRHLCLESRHTGEHGGCTRQAWTAPAASVPPFTLGLCIREDARVMHLYVKMHHSCKLKEAICGGCLSTSTCSPLAAMCGARCGLETSRHGNLAMCVCVVNVGWVRCSFEPWHTPGDTERRGLRRTCWRPSGRATRSMCPRSRRCWRSAARARASPRCPPSSPRPPRRLSLLRVPNPVKPLALRGRAHLRAVRRAR